MKSGVILWLPLVAAVCVLPSQILGQDRTFTREQYGEDFDSLVSFVTENYAYFDASQAWKTVPSRFRSAAVSAATTSQFIGVLEQVIDELHDPHAHLGVNTASSPNLIPSGTDLWAELRDGRATITQVRAGSPADSVGIRAGMIVRAVDGAPVERAIESKLSGGSLPPSQQAREWALRAILAGRRNAIRRLSLYDGSSLIDVHVRALDGGLPSEVGLLTHRVLTGNVGYVRPLNSLGESDLVLAFDSALAELDTTRGMILDLRDTPSGGNTAVARGLMGRLIQVERAYQIHRMPHPDGSPDVMRGWIELVIPRGGRPYANPLVVLVDHWTGSMGEGIAIGLDGMARATIVGTRMAGLKGATYSLQLPNTGFSVNVPAERLYHINGLPRESFVPTVLVDMTAKSDEISGDRLLERGLRVLKKQLEP